MEEFSDIVILCIGTNKIIGDCIGPLVGEKLRYLLKDRRYITIYGNMKETVNFKNAEKVIKHVFNHYQKPFIITVDAALGKKEMINNIIINKGKIQIGNALGHSICYPSHINIKGVVGEYKEDIQENMKTLSKISKETIDKLSNQITYKIYQMIKVTKNV